MSYQHETRKFYINRT